MQVGEVRVAEDADFQSLKNLCECQDGWKLEYNNVKSHISVWTKQNNVSEFKLIRVRGEYKDVAATTLYDVLHDPEYRKVWDSNMLEGYEICCLNPNNDIGYYALKCPSPMKNRDFVILRSWLDTGKEYYIINHSVNHQSIQKRKRFVRGISYLTGYLIRPLSEHSDRGCELYYVTQSDPKGKLPTWIVNKATQILAPRIIHKIHKACKNYQSWKAKHNPNYKPWIYPEQISLPRLNLSDISNIQETQSTDSLDESGLIEEDFAEDDLKDEEIDEL